MNMTARLFLTSLISASLFAIAANADTPPNKSVPPLMPPPAMGENPTSSDVATAPAEAPIEMGAPAAPTTTPVVAPAAKAKPLADKISGSRTVVIKGSGHMMMTERPDETLAALKQLI